jgi:hypothetical protein
MLPHAADHERASVMRAAVIAWRGDDVCGDGCAQGTSQRTDRVAVFALWWHPHRHRQCRALTRSGTPARAKLCGVVDVYVGGLILNVDECREIP